MGQDMVVKIFNFSVNYVGCKLTFKTIFVKKNNKLQGTELELDPKQVPELCHWPPILPIQIRVIGPPPFPGFVFVHASSTVQCLDPYYICTLYQKKVTFGADATEYVWIIQTYTVASAPAVHWLDFFCKDSHF